MKTLFVECQNGCKLHLQDLNGIQTLTVTDQFQEFNIALGDAGLSMRDCMAICNLISGRWEESELTRLVQALSQGD